MMTVSEYIDNKWRNPSGVPTALTVKEWMREYAEMVINECAGWIHYCSYYEGYEEDMVEDVKGKL